MNKTVFVLHLYEVHACDLGFQLAFPEEQLVGILFFLPPTAAAPKTY